METEVEMSISAPLEVTNISFFPASLLLHHPTDPKQPASGSMKMTMTKWTLQKEYNQHQTQDGNITSFIEGTKNIFLLSPSSYTEVCVAVGHN